MFMDEALCAVGFSTSTAQASYFQGTTALLSKPLCRLCLRGPWPGLPRLPSALPEPQAELRVLHGLIHHPHFFSGEVSV